MLLSLPKLVIFYQRIPEIIGLDEFYHLIPRVTHKTREKQMYPRNFLDLETVALVMTSSNVVLQLILLIVLAITYDCLVGFMHMIAQNVGLGEFYKTV